MTHVMSAATTQLLALATQYTKHQALSTWLLPLSGVLYQSGATLSAFGSSCMGFHSLHTQRAYEELPHNEHQSFAYQLPEELRNNRHQSQIDHRWAAATEVHRIDQAILFPQMFGDQPPTSEPAPKDTCKELMALYEKYLEAIFQSQGRINISNNDQLFNKFKSQIEAETRAAQQSQKKYIKQVKSLTAAALGSEMGRSKRLMEHWSQGLQTQLGEQLSQARQLGSISTSSKQPQGSSTTANAVLWPVLASLGPGHAAHIVVQVLLQKLLSVVASDVNRGKKYDGVPVSVLATQIGERIEDAIRWGRLRQELQEGSHKAEEAMERVEKMLQVLTAVCDMGVVRRSQLSDLQEARHTADLLANRKTWPKELKQQVGLKLLAQIKDMLIVPQTGEAAFEQQVVNVGGNTSKGKQENVLVWSPTPALTTYLLRDRELDAQHFIDSRFRPMLVPPRPWTGLNEGGLLLADPPLIHGYQTQDNTEWMATAFSNGKYDRVINALNVLGQTPWRINTRVLQAVKHLPRVHSNTAELLGYPPRTVPLLPQSPTVWGTRDKHGRSSATPDAKETATRHVDKACTPNLRFVREGLLRGQLCITAGPLRHWEVDAYRQELREAKQKMANMLSLAGEHDARVEVANQLSTEPCLYFPHFIDFRGRAYPVTQYLHHQGDDLARGLLEFAHGKPLGEQGLRWLFIQVANCWGSGKDKLSLDARYEFGRSFESRCAATAADPWSGAGAWWQEGEDPWQLLATSLEIHAAISSGNPAAYSSHVPVHQDGSCNGLQHYAALARDTNGASAVSMLPCEHPQDVYSAVARVVDAEVKKDASRTHDLAMKLLSRNDGVVDRKLIKQTVMTTVYGVTLIGARDQIAARLMERGWTREDERFQVANYLAKLTLKCVGKVFTNAEPVKQWLAESASCVAKTGQRVAWTSAMGFPIVQPYVKEVKTTGPFSEVSLEGGSSVTVDVRGQRTAFPPNFIHSLDASHMMMTAEACNHAGLTFAGVHDSFFTHAGSVDEMNTILRKEFVKLHSQPLLERLAEQLRSMGVNNLPPIPPPGDLDIRCVLNAPYFFS